MHLVLVDLTRQRARRPAGRGPPPRGPVSPSTATPSPTTRARRRVTSGLRIGTPALATRGFGTEEFTEVADIIALALTGGEDIESLRARTAALAEKMPLYAELQQH